MRARFDWEWGENIVIFQMEVTTFRNTGYVRALCRLCDVRLGQAPEIVKTCPT